MTDRRRSETGRLGAALLDFVLAVILIGTGLTALVTGRLPIRFGGGIEGVGALIASLVLIGVGAYFLRSGWRRAARPPR